MSRWDCVLRGTWAAARLQFQRMVKPLEARASHGVVYPAEHSMTVGAHAITYGPAAGRMIRRAVHGGMQVDLTCQLTTISP